MIPSFPHIEQDSGSVGLISPPRTADIVNGSSALRNPVRPFSRSFPEIALRVVAEEIRSFALRALPEEIGPAALRARFRNGFVTEGEIALRVVGARVEQAEASLAFDDLPPVLRARHAGFDERFLRAGLA